MATYAVDTGWLRGRAGDAAGDAEEAEALRAVAQTLRAVAAAAGSAQVEDAGWRLASRIGAHIEGTTLAGQVLARGLDAAASLYAEAEARVDALFIPRWIP